MVWRVRLLLAQLKTPHGSFRASVRGFCCLDGKSYAREAKPFQGPCFSFCCTVRPAALPRRKKPPSRLCPAPPCRPLAVPAGHPKSSGRSLMALSRVPGRPDGPGFPCRPRTAPAGLQWSHAPPPAPAGPASRTGPWGSRRGRSSGSIPNRWKSYLSSQKAVCAAIGAQRLLPLSMRETGTCTVTVTVTGTVTGTGTVTAGFAALCRLLPLFAGNIRRKGPRLLCPWFPAGSQWPPAPPPAPAGPASRTGPWGSRPGWSSVSIPNRWKSSLFAKGGVCRHRRTASFASLYERDRNMYMYSYRHRNRNSYSLICCRLLSKSSICLICLRLPGK